MLLPSVSWLRVGEKSLIRYILRHLPCTIKLQSHTFRHGQEIPQRCADKPRGDNVSPDLRWSDLPTECPYLTLIMQDRDALFFLGGVGLVATIVDPHRQQQYLLEGALNWPRPSYVLSDGYSGPGNLLNVHHYVVHAIALRNLGRPGNYSIDTQMRQAVDRDEVVAWGQLEGFF